MGWTHDDPSPYVYIYLDTNPYAHKRQHHYHHFHPQSSTCRYTVGGDCRQVYLLFGHIPDAVPYA